MTRAGFSTKVATVALKRCSSLHAKAPRSSTVRRLLSLPVWAHVMVLAWLGPLPASAAPRVNADVQARYLQERAVCMSGRSNQDRATCLTEASAARAQALREGLGEGASSYERNVRQRCERLPDDDRRACEARMEGQGTTSGSAASGGIYRELVTRKVGAPVAVEPAGVAASEPAR